MKRKKDYSAEREEKIKALTDKLEQGIKEVFTSEKYKEYLSTMGRFHNYSYNNLMLIAMQRPGASLLAGFKTWESLGRRVKKGEKGIAILVPCPYKFIKEVGVVDPETGKAKLDADGNQVKAEKEISYTYFKPAAIFDVSQTEGKELPALAEELKGDAQDYENLMDAIRETASVPIRFEDWDKSKKGHYDLNEKEIVIKSGMSERQTVKTAIHETAHSILHTDKERLKDSATMEIEAESIAFVVCQHFGLDTSDYSFGYLAGWSSTKELPELKSSLSAIQKEAHGLIDRIEKNLLKHTNNLDISQNIREGIPEVPGLGDTLPEPPGISGNHRHRR